MPRPAVSVVILTRGDRPRELAQLVASVRRQEGVDCEIVLVANGCGADTAAGGLVVDQLIESSENVGIPAGRNLGAASASFDVLAFLDDDGQLRDPDTLARAIREFADGVAVVALRIADEHGSTERRHVPRVGGGSAEREGDVAGFLGGAVLIRADAFGQVGGYDGRFFYAMEETDLMWRLADRGWRARYAPDAVLLHPRTSPSRHPSHDVHTARNRLWAAWKSLPLPLAAIYLIDWMVIGLVRDRSIGATVTGYREAWADRPERCPMSWSTVLRLSRVGRPPVI